MEFDGVDLPSYKMGEGETAEKEKEVSDPEESGGEVSDEAKDSPVTTRSGRTLQARTRFIEGTSLMSADYEISLIQAEIMYYEAMKEFPEGEFAPGEMACVGAGLGGRFDNTKELHVMKYDQAMAGEDTEKWKVAVKEEHGRMEDHEVFKAVPRDEVPEGAKILTYGR
jgi:hypothetical protein